MNFIQFSNIKTPKDSNKPNTKRLINEANTNALKNALLNTDWQPVYADNNVDSSFNTFWNLFTAHFTEHCPVVHIRFNKNKHKLNGYMNDELLAEGNIKLHLHKTSLSTRLQEDHNKYIAQRNKYNTLLRQSKQKYYTDNLHLNINNSKRTWQLLKDAANLSKASSTVEKIDKNGTLITNPTDIANEFNDFFTSIGTKIADSITPTIVKPEDFMPQPRKSATTKFGLNQPKL
jgi:hypothetical protein